MASVASQLIGKSLHMRKVTVSRMRERYAQTVLTFRITYTISFKMQLNDILYFICQMKDVRVTTAMSVSQC